MEAEQKAMILGLASLIVGGAALVSEKYRLYIILLFPLVLIYYFITSYINKTEENSSEIKKLKEKLIIYERLSKLEAKVFKWIKKV